MGVKGLQGWEAEPIAHFFSAILLSSEILLHNLPLVQQFCNPASHYSWVAQPSKVGGHLGTSQPALQSLFIKNDPLITTYWIPHTRIIVTGTCLHWSAFWQVLTIFLGTTYEYAHNTKVITNKQ